MHIEELQRWRDRRESFGGYFQARPLGHFLGGGRWKSAERQQLKTPGLLPPQIKIVNHTPRQQNKSQPLHFIFALEDPTQQTKTLQLFYRSDAQQKYAALAMQPEEKSRWQLVLQPQGPSMHRVQYYAAALGAANQPLAFLGHPEQPFEIQHITAAATEPFYKRTWFWGTLLTGLSLAGLTHYMLITNKDEPPGDEVISFP